MSAGAGDVLGGRYELVRPLATGGMGTVWLGRHLELETEVAIKLVEGSVAERPDLLERFRREARAAAQLKTPHVVQILDFGTDGGTPYLAMELLEGEDLEALLARDATLSPARVVEIVRPLCRALDVAHAAGIVHRDLKPANVFVARVAGDEVIKLVDFGIAKELHRGAQHTTGAAVIGSPLFMSPEQIDEKSAVDERTDVWALGVMTHLMLTGTTPFVATTIASILYKIVHEPIELPSVHAPSLAPFDGFFQKALARTVAERYGSVTELLAGYEEALAHVEVPSVAIPPRQRAGVASETAPMHTSERPPPEAFGPPPPAAPATTEPAAPVDVADAARPTPRRASARPRPASTLPTTWIVGGASAAVGAAIAVGVLSSKGARGDADPAASASSSAPAIRSWAPGASRRTRPKVAATSQQGAASPVQSAASDGPASASASPSTAASPAATGSPAASASPSSAGSTSPPPSAPTTPPAPAAPSAPTAPARPAESAPPAVTPAPSTTASPAPSPLAPPAGDGD